MIKAILFDCFGVLTTDKWKEFVATLPEDQKQEARDLNRARDTALISRAEFLESIISLTGAQPEDVELMHDNEIVKNKELLDYIAELKRTYKIGLLSNVSSNWIRDKLLSLEEQKLFDSFIFSYEVKLVKPDPEIFNIAAQRLEVDLGSCVLVDDIDYYCDSAKVLGMKTVAYKNFLQTKTELNKLLQSR